VVRIHATAAAAFSVAAALLAVAVWYQPAGTAANVIADVVLAATLTISVRAYLLHRDRKRYATEARQARRPLEERLHRITEYLWAQHGQAAKLAIPGPRIDWYDYSPLDTGDPLNPFALPPIRPEQLDASDLTPPATEADLLTAFDTFRSGYPGPDLSRDLRELAKAVATAPEAWAMFAKQYNVAEALAPEPLMPGWPVDADAYRELHVPKEAAYHEAARPLKELAEGLQKQRAAIDDQVAALRVKLDDGYHPRDLARRDTPDPFPRWVLQGAIAVGAAAALAWGLSLLFDNLGRDVTDNVLVGLAAFATGVGLTAIAGHLAEQRVLREAREPRAAVLRAITTLEVADHPAVDPGARAAVRGARGELRRGLHELQYISPDPRLDSFGDLAVDRIDAWLAAAEPDEDERVRMRAALAQVRELVTALFPEPPAAPASSADFDF
jgi:hypothetical protein